MHDDILERLVDFDNYGNTATERLSLRKDAWDEIMRLRALLAGLGYPVVTKGTKS